MSTSIEWTDVTWNPVTGCDRVSPGCAHCYALTLAKRLKAMGHPAYQVDGGKASGPGFAVQLHPDRLEAPLHWRRPRRVFVNSMSDLFHEDVPDEFIDQVFGVMAATPQHTYQVLTKRPERMLEYLTAVKPDGSDTAMLGHAGAHFRVDRLAAEHEAQILDQPIQWREEVDPVTWPLPNVWLGVSVENQRWANHRIPLLLQTPAAVRFLSCEPLIGPLRLGRDLPAPDLDGCCYRCGRDYPDPRFAGNETHRCAPGHQAARIDWVIIGGESGPGHRPFDPEWARWLRIECAMAGVPLFVKQLGGARPGSKLEDLPEDLRIREFPA